jgi:hypothetical protein
MDEHGDHPEIRLERALRGKQCMVVLRMDALAEMDVSAVGASKCVGARHCKSLQFFE